MGTKPHHRVVKLLAQGGQSFHMDILPFVGLTLALLLGWGAVAAAQSLTAPLGSDSRPVVHGTGGMRPPTQMPLFSGSQNATVKMHMGPTGRPCLAVYGYAQPQTVNPNIFTHMISASNDCSQLIKMQVCYYQSQHCTPIAVPGYGRKEAILGIMPAMKDFRFEYREQFDQGSIFGGASTNFSQRFRPPRG